MSWIKDYKINICAAYINLMFVLGLIKLCYQIENFSYLTVTMLFVFGVLIYWFYHSFLRKMRYKLLFTLLLFVLFGAFYFLKSGEVQQFFLHGIINNIIDINSATYNITITDFSQYIYLFMIIIPLLTIIIMFFITKRLPNFMLIFNLFAAVYLWYTRYVDQIKGNLYKFILICLITYSLNNYVTRSKKLAADGVKLEIDGKKIFVYILAISLFISAICSLLPQEYSGKYVTDIQSKFENRFVSTKEENIAKGDKLKYDLSQSGYDSSSKKLGGPIYINSSTVLKVKSDRPYYLIGSIKDFYDGFSWNQSDKNYKMKNTSNLNELKDNFSLDFLSREDVPITIYPSGLNSSTLFVPDYTYNVSLSKGDVIYDNTPTFMSSSIVDKPYNVYFYKISDFGTEFLNSLNKIMFNSKIYPTKTDQYLQLPKNISPRIYNLVKEITKNCITDKEKVDAIENYLKTQYKYSLKVSDVPKGQEFVDYFLFTEKKGYCTYFATAATIMCRIAGVPARYVEGFNMTDKKDSKGLYDVTNQNAHAWAQVLYVNDFAKGLWVNLDCVPNASSLIQEEYKKDTQVQPSSDDDGLSIPVTQRNRKVEKEEKTSTSGTTVKKDVKVPKKEIAITLISLVVLFIAARIGMQIKKKRYAMKNHSIIPLYLLSLNRLETIGITMPGYQGDLEFINTIEDEDLRYQLRSICDLAYKEYYGNVETAEIDKKAFYTFIDRYIRERQNVFIFGLNKYFYFRLKLKKKKNK